MMAPEATEHKADLVTSGNVRWQLQRQGNSSSAWNIIASLVGLGPLTKTESAVRLQLHCPCGFHMSFKFLTLQLSLVYKTIKNLHYLHVSRSCHLGNSSLIFDSSVSLSAPSQLRYAPKWQPGRWRPTKSSRLTRLDGLRKHTPNCGVSFFLFFSCFPFLPNDIPLLVHQLSNQDLLFVEVVLEHLAVKPTAAKSAVMFNETVSLIVPRLVA